MQWYPLTLAAARKNVGVGKLFFGVATSGQAYTGVVEAITDRYVELTNGPHREIVYYGQRTIRFCMIELPAGHGFGVKDSELPLLA